MQSTVDQKSKGVAFFDDQPVLLVVDDDPDILRVVEFYLAKQKYKVYTASSGKEALSILHQGKKIELILSDVMMPDMNGLDLLKAVRENPDFADLPVILISAEGETSKKVIGLNLGADDFITKPFNFDELMARVQNHIRLWRLQKEVLIASKQVMQANQMLQLQNDRFLEDLEAARRVQMALLPDTLPTHDKFQMGSRYQPVDRLGGDIFDIVPLDGGDKLGVMIADVCGHGVAAAFITAMTKITFQSACYGSLDPSEVLGRMNHELYSSLKSGYVTVFYGIYDLKNNTFSFASGGHPPLLLYRRAEQKIIELNPQATFLGIFHPVQFESGSIELQMGDRIFFYTDGLYESQLDQGDEFGIVRVRQIIQDNKDQPIQTVVDQLIDNLMDFMDGKTLDDDITIVGLDIRA